MEKECKSRKVNPTERIVLKKKFIENEFIKVVEEILNTDLNRDFFNCIKSELCIEMIEDYSDYGKELIKLDYDDYLDSDDCFLSFINFDFYEFASTWSIFYNLCYKKNKQISI